MNTHIISRPPEVCPLLCLLLFLHFSFSSNSCSDCWIIQITWFSGRKRKEWPTVSNSLPVSQEGLLHPLLHLHSSGDTQTPPLWQCLLHTTGKYTKDLNLLSLILMWVITMHDYSKLLIVLVQKVNRGMILSLPLVFSLSLLILSIRSLASKILWSWSIQATLAHR